jgi:ABC-type transport system involved in multi-copper enzyme maturation permease subunit
MMPTIKSEFRKLFTIRSTYIITALVVAFLLFIAFYVEGWRLKPGQLADPHQLASDVYGGLTLMVFGAIVGILSMTHEYRYNTIMYTLTSTNRRSRVLASKIIVISAYAIGLAILLGILSPLATYLGVHAHGHALATQVFYYKDLVWHTLFFGWSYGMIGLLLATIIRQQPGSVAALFVLPAVVEPLLSQLLNKNAVYLPFAALSQLVGDGAVGGGSLAPGKAALVVMVYLVIGWAVAWYLFLRRDAA